jgi:hypothetical protein
MLENYSVAKRLAASQGKVQVSGVSSLQKNSGKAPRFKQDLFRPNPFQSTPRDVLHSRY